VVGGQAKINVAQVGQAAKIHAAKVRGIADSRAREFTTYLAIWQTAYGLKLKL
jgi:hypothetical protein